LSYYNLPLFPIQQEAYKKISYNLGEGQPTILWAGRQSGKTEVCRRVSHMFEAAPQIAIGYSPGQFEGFLIEEHNCFHPAEVVLEFGYELERIWETVTPGTIVFIDNLFELPFCEELFNSIANVTPHIVAMSSHGIEDAGISVNKYVNHIFGPYATWEMNPLMDADSLRSGTKNAGERRKLNDELVACVNTKHTWKDWACKS
jgi:hypothetical protein